MLVHCIFLLNGLSYCNPRELAFGDIFFWLDSLVFLHFQMESATFFFQFQTSGYVLVHCIFLLNGLSYCNPRELAFGDFFLAGLFGFLAFSNVISYLVAIYLRFLFLVN
jgi:hypothetical protein